MKSFLKILLSTAVLFCTFMKAQDLKKYRQLIANAEKSESIATEYLRLAESDYKSTKLPIYLSYTGVGNFFMAKHASNPFTKLSYFKKGKKALEEAIKKDPKNLEMRFLRYISQQKTPGFLGYKSSLEMDKKFILENYKSTNDLELKKQIIGYFKL